mgnify:CR=1 FL=1
MFVYKLTDRDGYTRRGTRLGETYWEVGVSHSAPGGALCTADVIHAYIDPLVAVFMDPIHGAYLPTALLWEGEGVVCVDDGTKLGLTRFTPHRQLPLPVLLLLQRAETAIRCALAVYTEPSYHTWALAWLDGQRAAREVGAALEVALLVRTADRTVWATRTAEHAALAVAQIAAGTPGVSELAAWVAVWALKAAQFNLAAIIHQVVNPDKSAESSPSDLTFLARGLG